MSYRYRKRADNKKKRSDARNGIRERERCYRLLVWAVANTSAQHLENNETKQKATNAYVDTAVGAEGAPEGAASGATGAPVGPKVVAGVVPEVEGDVVGGRVGRAVGVVVGNREGFAVG